MDNVAFVHIIDEHTILGVNSPVKMQYEFNEGSLTKMCRFVDSLSIIVPLSIDSNVILKVIAKILQDSLIENVVVNSPCTLVSMALSMDNLIFIALVPKENSVTANVEAIKNRNVDMLSVCALKGDIRSLSEQICERFCILDDIASLYERLYVYSPEEKLRKNFYTELEKVLNEKTKQNKKITRLSVSTKLASHQQFKFSEKNPIYIGSWLLTKTRFFKTNHFSTRDSFIKKDYTQLSID
ncbi:hypothetical protein THOM_1876 [Trachipleistophora hominis]|uniref:Uncharacterized protein n=1 Tax=Trachipleistophora hominis TaxID=72359 RepID=L7JVT4_TRAHO|nr:hypothetical protein THOM_1876 [Trachipleistophora hominis]